MRPIKFRAWDNRNKKWLLGYDMPNLGGFSLFGETILLGEWSAVLDKYVFERGDYKIEDLKVMQFTGLLDKNGKEIYENDVVRYKVQGTNNKDWFGKICYFWCRFAIQLNNGGIDDLEEANQLEIEVIGNIYENPKLLTQT